MQSSDHVPAHHYVEAIAERNEAIAKCLVLEAKLTRLREALNYIAHPTMGYPGVGPWTHVPMPDREQWVRRGNGTEHDIRLALATCIWTATNALKDWEAFIDSKGASPL